MYKRIFTTLLVVLLLTVSNICTVALAHVVRDTSASPHHMMHSTPADCDHDKNCDSNESCCFSNLAKQPYISQLIVENETPIFPSYHTFPPQIVAIQQHRPSILTTTPQLIRIGITVKRE